MKWNFPMTDGEYERFMSSHHEDFFIQMACYFKRMHAGLAKFPDCAFRELKIGMCHDLQTYLLHTSEVNGEKMMRLVRITIEHAVALLESYWLQKDRSALDQLRKDGRRNA